MLHNEHQTLTHKLMHDKMSKIYIFQALLTFVKSLIGIFAPVYIYSLGYSFTFVLLFIIGISFTYLFLIPFTTKLINKIGFKYSILFSIPIYIAHIATLNYIELSHIIFHLAWFSYGTHMAIFWPAMHSEIVMNGNKKKAGNQIGTLQIIVTLVSALAPLIGGFFLEYLEFFSLLVLCFIITLIGSIPLLFSQDIRLQNHTYKYSDYIKLLDTPKYKTSAKVFFAEGIENFLNLSIWPILLFILLQNNFLSLGTLFSAVSVISLFLIMYFKKYIDNHSKQKVLKKTVKLKSFGWLLRLLMFLFSGLLIYVVETITKLTNSVFGLTYMSMFYNNARLSNPMDYVVLREIGIHCAKITLGVITIFAIEIFGEIKEIFTALIIIGIIAAIFIGRMKEEL